MPFSVSEFINSLSERALSSPGISAVLENPIFVALIISVVVIVIVMFVFRSAEMDDPIYVMGFRAGFWTFITSVLIIFTHNKILHKESIAHATNGSYDELFAPIVGYDDKVVLEQFDITNALINTPE